MSSFIDEVLIDIQKKDVDIAQLTFVLPSKRAGNFLKRSLSKLSYKTIFAPTILSIEEFVEDVSLLKSITNTELLFLFYQIYRDLTPKNEVELFDSFCKWAQVVLQDFNEIDRYLISNDKIFNYLKAIKEVNHWSLEPEKTNLVTNYLSFWKKLPQYYNGLINVLLKNGKGYQGLIYREAVNQLEHYINHHPKKHHIFLGFNALNTAEKTIIQELLHQGLADIYWDIDHTFLEAEHHDAALFIGRHRQWSYFKNNAFKWLSKHYKSDKNIHAIGIPKNTGQAKYAGELLAQLSESKKNLNNTALVLGDESLITPIINAVPKQISSVNVTMGMPLHLVPLASLFEALFQLLKADHKSKIYYKEVISIISNPFIKPILDVNDAENTSRFVQHITKNNITHIGLENLKKMFPTNLDLIDQLFGNWQNKAGLGLKHCAEIIQCIKADLDKDKDSNLLALEYLFKFNQIFNQLSTLITTFDFLEDIKTLFSLYKEVLSTETLDFQGEPLQGLQIIGMLESRAIDFETVIITSVNEGVLPSGKSNNSFIPFDVKLEYGLPTYKEKDAVYTYHFYHLLQRAKNIYILYNTETDALKGGEKSRFITQLEVEGIHTIKHYSVAPKIVANGNESKAIKKTDPVIKELKELARNGFSPSALTAYIRNPIDFYNQKILGINSFEDIEETVAANTLGTILHNTLEDLYTPFVGTILNSDTIKSMASKIESCVKLHFKKEFKEGEFLSGKNLIVFEIAKRYISNFLNKELEAINNGQQIKILSLERKMSVEIDIPELNFPVFLKGTVDRIDECDGVIRIIDYKSGKVNANELEIVNWNDLTTDYRKYSKAFQILTYAYIMRSNEPIRASVEAGIISFKNLQKGVLKFAKKESLRSRNKDVKIAEETLELYFAELKKLILEICNPEIDFIERGT